MTRERLNSYSVHEGPSPAADRIDRAEALEFVKDGFLRQVFVLPPFWLARRGIWLGVLAYLMVASAILLAAWSLALPGWITLLAFLLLHLIFASEADEMLRARLAARGWTMVGQVSGTGRLDCERRFYDQWLPSVPISLSTNSSGSRSQDQNAPGPSAVVSAPLITPPKGNGILGNFLSPLRRTGRA